MRNRSGLVWCAALCALGCGSWSGSAFADTLERAGNEVRGRGSSHPRPTHEHEHGASHHAGRSHELDSEAAAELAYVLLSSPWTLPNALVEADRPEGAAARTAFARWPYADGEPGYLTEQSSKRVAVQLSADSGVDLGARLWRHGLGLRVQFPYRLELDSDWSLFHEDGEASVGQAWLGREHVALRFAESDTLQFRTGLGARHFRDARGWVHGVDLSYGIDAFLGRPVLLGLEGSVGNLGQAFAPSVRAILGVLLGPIELDAGWDQRWVGAVAMGGPRVGARLWF